MGPMTGRQAGFCAGYNVPGYANPVGGGFGRGFGRGMGGGFGRQMGGGRGWRNRFYATGLTGWQRAGMVPGAVGAPAGPVDEAQQLEMLKTQAETLSETLEGIRRRIEQLEAGPEQA
jgi:hypothetical protein